MMFQNNQNCFTSFIEGYMCAVIGERLTVAKVSETELDNVKRLAEKCVEIKIDYSPLSEEEKKAQKDKYKLWSELAFSMNSHACSARQYSAMLKFTNY